MLSSFRIARIAGIDVKVHSTFLLLLAWTMFSDYGRSHSLNSAFGAAGFILILFTIIVMHEFGHAMAAKYYGIKTKQIMLLPIGGLASLDRIPEDPKKEFVVAIAGPMVNVVLALLCFAGLQLTGHGLGGGFSSWGLLSRLFWTNVGLIIFNMIPAFPMDGGRVLRSLLAMVIGRPKATKVAAGIGQFLAICFGVLGLLFQPFLILTAIFIWIGARAESKQVELESAVHDASIREVMLRSFVTLTPEMSLDAAAQLGSQVFQTEFPVVANGQPIGMATKAAILDALGQGFGATVHDVMTTHVVMATPNETVLDLLPRWQNAGTNIAVVVDFGQVVGLVTPREIAHFIQVRRAPRAPRGAVPPVATFELPEQR